MHVALILYIYRKKIYRTYKKTKIIRSTKDSNIPSVDDKTSSQRWHFHPN